MKSKLNVEDLILNYDPEFPQQRFISAGLPGALKSSTGRLPGVPFHGRKNPSPLPCRSIPRRPRMPTFPGSMATTPLSSHGQRGGSRGAGRDADNPDYLPSRWYEYRYNVSFLRQAWSPESRCCPSTIHRRKWPATITVWASISPCKIGAARWCCCSNPVFN